MKGLLGQINNTQFPHDFISSRGFVTGNSSLWLAKASVISSEFCKQLYWNDVIATNCFLTSTNSGVGSGYIYGITRIFHSLPQ
jgi:hypothetical protein